MRTAARLVSALALLGTIVPAVLFMTDRVTLESVQLWMLIATVAWFASTPLWMDRSRTGGAGL